MIETLRNAWKIEDLRKKILYTILIIAVFRIGAVIPVPFIDASYLSSMFSDSGNLMGYFNMITGGSFQRATIFALSITPYINASIIIQLLTVAIPPLEKLAQEGPEGQKKIQRIVRYTAIGLSVGLSIAYFFLLKRSGALQFADFSTKSAWLAAIAIIACFAAGAMLIVWLGEQIDKRGIGNGISLLIFAGIVSSGATVVTTAYSYLQLAASGGAYTKYYFLIPLFVVLAVVVTAFVVLMTEAERRIPVQYAKRVVGRKMYGGQSSHIDIKVNMSGVLPIIFASAIMSIPGTIKTLFVTDTTSTLYKVLSVFDYNSLLYAVLYFFLIIGFNYFYVAIQYNPMEIANQLRQNNGAIPGIRSGRPTYEYIAKAISKVTIIGALFLAFVAILPILLARITGVNIALGGTSLLIVVGVALDVARTLETHMVMRHHKGFLDK